MSSDYAQIAPPRPRIMAEADAPDPREVYLTCIERAALLRTLDELSQAKHAYERHKRSALTAADVNPAGDMGGIRSWSAKKKERMWNRVYKDARRSILLYEHWAACERAIPFILSGGWMERRLAEQRARAERAERSRRNAEMMARRDQRRAERYRRAAAARRARAADLAAYNQVAQFVHDFAEARQHDHAGHAKRWAEMTLTDHYHDGARDMWIEVQATIAAAHLRGAGERATSAMILADLARARRGAISYQAANPKDARIAARTWGALATEEKIRAMFVAGELALP